MGQHIIAFVEIKTRNHITECSAANVAPAPQADFCCNGSSPHWSQVGPGLWGGREEAVQSHQLFPLTKARSTALSGPASCTIKSFRLKASIQETKVRDPGLPALIALLGPGTNQPRGVGCVCFAGYRM